MFYMHICQKNAARTHTYARAWAYIYIYIYIYTHSFTRVGWETRSVFMRSSTSLNGEFSFSLTSWHTKVKEFSLPYYLSIAWEIRSIRSFPTSISAMRTVSSGIRYCITVSISYDGNPYIRDTYIYIYMCVCVCVYVCVCVCVCMCVCVLTTFELSDNKLVIWSLICWLCPSLHCT